MTALSLNWQTNQYNQEEYVDNHFYARIFNVTWGTAEAKVYSRWLLKIIVKGNIVPSPAHMKISGNYPSREAAQIAAEKIMNQLSFMFNNSNDNDLQVG